MIVVAGPPGSGKSTYFPVSAFGVDSFSIDDRSAQVAGSYRAIPLDVRRAVVKECERFIRQHMDQRRSFALETTLRTTASIDQAREARTLGFGTELIFIATDSVDENIARVLQRAQGGGHGASERDVRTIYEASIANLRAALGVFERAAVYDSTVPWSVPRAVGVAASGETTLIGATPAWLKRALE